MKIHTYRAGTLAAVFGLALVLSACGDSQGSGDNGVTGGGAPTDEAPAPEQTSQSDQAEPSDAQAAPDATEGDDEQRFGASLEQTGDVIVDTFEEATDYTVDGDTLKVNFSEGGVEFDGSLDCMSVGGLMGDGETLTLVYPDGSVDC